MYTRVYGYTYIRISVLICIMCLYVFMNIWAYMYPICVCRGKVINGWLGTACKDLKHIVYSSGDAQGWFRAITKEYLCSQEHVDKLVLAGWSPTDGRIMLDEPGALVMEAYISAKRRRPHARNHNVYV